MTQLFGRDYASIYDSLYQAKDYEREVDRIEDVLLRHRSRARASILDLGCGTGGHAIPLASRGHDVIGVDRSQEMLAQARAKSCSPTASARLEFQEADLRQLNLKKQFDAVLMMFTVLGYQQSASDISAALSSVRRHLEADGIFVFDVWNGLAVLEHGPGQRTLEVRRGEERIVRRGSAQIRDRARQLCDVYFDITHTAAGGAERTWREVHTLRYFFPQELAPLLWASNLELLDLRAFPDEGAPDASAWTILGVARRR